MGENFRLEARPLPTYLTGVCRRSLSHRATESEMSDLTTEDSKHAVNRNRNQNVFHQATSDRKDPRRILLTDIQGEATKWTDEKHCSYLNFLETSLVNQLCCSKGLVGSCANGKNSKSSQQLSGNNPVNCHLFSSHCRSVGKNQIMSSSDSQQCFALKSKEAHLKGNASFSCGLASSSKQLQMGCLCHDDPIGSIQEGLDQNFKDEDPAETSSNLPGAKRLKMVSTNPSSKDQVVPS